MLFRHAGRAFSSVRAGSSDSAYSAAFRNTRLRHEHPTSSIPAAGAAPVERKPSESPSVSSGAASFEISSKSSDAPATFVVKRSPFEIPFEYSDALATSILETASSTPYSEPSDGFFESSDAFAKSVLGTPPSPSSSESFEISSNSGSRTTPSKISSESSDAPATLIVKTMPSSPSSKSHKSPPASTLETVPSSPSSKSSKSPPASTLETVPSSSSSDSFEALPTSTVEAAPSSSASEVSDIYQILTLDPPWQVDELSKWEQEALKKHGPKYLEHLEGEGRRLAGRNITRRRKFAKRSEAELGPDWYAITREGNARFQTEVRSPAHEEIERYHKKMARIAGSVDPSADSLRLKALKTDLVIWDKSKEAGEARRRMSAQIKREFVDKLS